MIYQYRREDGSVFEAEQAMSDTALERCPETGQKCHRIITGGRGALLPREKTVKYRDGNFITRPMAKQLEANPLATTLSDKRKRIEENTEKAKNERAKAVKKAFGRTTGLGDTGL